jgi:signal transduction histidine kinase
VNITAKVLKTCKVDEDLRRGLQWIQATSEARGQMMDLLQDLALFLARQEKRLRGSPHQWDNSDEFGRWIRELVERIRLPFQLDADPPAKWTSPNVTPIVTLQGPCPISSKPIFDFIASELLRNAIQACSGNRPLHVDLRPDGDAAEFRVWNDLMMQWRKPGACAGCGTEGELFRNSLFKGPDVGECEKCFGNRVQRIISEMFEPGVTGNGDHSAGLGLFLVEFLVRNVLNGKITASVTTCDFVPVQAGTWRDDYGICMGITRR